ncbi:U-box domain-containing protein 51-like [Nymphaea colorata]|nr:U-box domain-containing protein 51-like [Nymphaea colorata]
MTHSRTSQIHDELEKIRFELHHVQEMFKLVQEQSDPSSKKSELSNHKDELELVTTEGKAREPLKYEKKKHEAADEEAEFVKVCLESELVPKKEAVVIASYKAKEKHKLENACAYLDNQFEKFGWEEISSATSSLSDTLRVGEGAFGYVYKCTLRHDSGCESVESNWHPERQAIPTVSLRY